MYQTHFLPQNWMSKTKGAFCGDQWWSDFPFEKFWVQWSRGDHVIPLDSTWLHSTTEKSWVMITWPPLTTTGNFRAVSARIYLNGNIFRAEISSGMGSSPSPKKKSRAIDRQDTKQRARLCWKRAPKATFNAKEDSAQHCSEGRFRFYLLVRACYYVHPVRFLGLEAINNIIDVAVWYQGCLK